MNLNAAVRAFIAGEGSEVQNTQAALERDDPVDRARAAPATCQPEQTNEDQGTMTMNRRVKPVAAAVGTAFVASIAGTAVADVDAEQAFSSTDLGVGYQLASADEGSCGEGKCGEGKCGESKGGEEGSCGEGKCGESKGGEEGSCGEGKCGEGKCGESKGGEEGSCGEGKCGEGKCGG
jgi:uncharacterized low-complexity protein